MWSMAAPTADIATPSPWVTGGMVPAAELLPQVLPTDRITVSAKAVPA